MDNKWLRAAIPALLIHCSIGTVIGVFGIMIF